MVKIKIAQQYIHVDITSELEPYFTSPLCKWSDSKLIAPSPFREDRNPSFFVNLDGEFAGTWADSGGLDEYRSGNLPKLLAYLMDTSYDEAVEYLLNKYASNRGAELSIRGCLCYFREDVEDKFFSMNWEAHLDEMDYAIERLYKRGIKPSPIVKANVRQDDYTIYYPYYDNDKIVAVKMRAITSKKFNVDKADGVKLSDHVFNLNNYKPIRYYIWITEGEADALTIPSNSRYLGVATGNANITQAQVDKILRTGCQHIVLAMDNDKAGQSFKRKAFRLFRGLVTLYDIDLKDCKDLNDYWCKYHKLPEPKPINELKMLAEFKMKPTNISVDE